MQMRLGASDAVESARVVRMRFGQYEGRTLGWIVDEHAEYFHYLGSIRIENPQLRAACGVIRLAYSESIERAMLAREHLR